MSKTTCPIPAGAEDHTDGTAHQYMLYAASGCTIATLVVSLSLIILHLRRYRAPKEQRQIIRMIFSLVVYSLFSALEIYRYEIAQYIDPIGDVYEAFGLCALFLLYVQYAAPAGTFDQDTFAAVKAQEEQASNFDWPRISWIFVFQYPVVEVLAVAIREITEVAGTYCSSSLSPRFGHLWVLLLSTLAIGPCVLAIFRFRGRMKNLMKVRRGMAKLVAFKLVVFIRFVQAWAFSLLLEKGVVKTSPSFSHDDLLWGVPALLTCAEMFLFSIGFWYAFSSSEYSSSAHPRDRPLPLWKAVLDALNPWDLMMGIARIVPLIAQMQRSGDFTKWTAARKEEKAAKRYRKNRQDQGGQHRYQGIHDDTTEPLGRPVEMHHVRSASNVSHEGTAYGGLAGHQMYRPPSGSPPGESNSYLMAEDARAAGGRARSESLGQQQQQQQWNGQRYDRSPSPAGRFVEESVRGRDMV